MAPLHCEVFFFKAKGVADFDKSRQYMCVQACCQLKIGIPEVNLSVSDFVKQPQLLKISWAVFKAALATESLL